MRNGVPQSACDLLRKQESRKREEHGFLLSQEITGERLSKE